MNMLRKLVTVLLLLLPANLHPVRLVIADTTASERIAFEPLLSLSAHCNAEVIYIALPELIDKGFFPQKNDMICFALSSALLQAPPSSPAATTILKVIGQSLQTPGTCTALFFPPRTKDIATVNQVLRAGNVQVGHDAKELLTKFLAAPLERRARAYHTTLMAPRTEQKPLLPTPSHAKILQSSVLPLDPSSVSDNVRSLLPFGVYWYNPACNNHIFVSSISALTMTGMNENFFLHPMQPEVREELLAAQQYLLWELTTIASIDARETRGVPAAHLKGHVPLLARSKPTKRGVPAANKSITAWMKIEIFGDDSKADEQAELIAHIINGGFTHLWLELCHNHKLGPRAQNPQGAEQLATQVANFTAQLHAAAEQQKATPPALLAGMIVDHNMPQEVPVEQQAVDVFGKHYGDLIAPLNQEFWQDEVVESFRRLATVWKQEAQLPLDGIVIDGEMYWRESMSTYSGVLGFNEATSSELKLENRAASLGKSLRQGLEGCIKNCQIGLYLPNLQSNWFYTGLYRGLGATDPLMLFTFNSEFEEYKPWFKAKGINATHHTVVMLSKLRAQQDVRFISDALKNNDGVWLNRFSKFVGTFDEGDVEAPRLDAQEKSEVMELQRKLTD